jgi:thiosulfate reductase cytochrome b subunit
MHRLAISGCLEGLRMVTKTGFLFLKFTSGHRAAHRDAYYLHVCGHVGFIVVHSQRLNPGVLDCIDS